MKKRFKINPGDLIQAWVVCLGWCLVRVTMPQCNMGHIESTETRMVPCAYGHYKPWYYEPKTAEMEEKC